MLQIFAVRLGLTLKVVGLDVEFNSESNGDIFEGGFSDKRWDFDLKY